MKLCEQCRFCILTDYGYSNWTVEGTDADCLLKKNPKFPIDRYYGEEVVLQFAEKCDSFKLGDPVSVDCEQELGELENYTEYEEVKFLLRQM